MTGMYGGKSAAQLLGVGWKRCLGRVATSSAGREERGSTMRRKGERCRILVSPDQVERHGGGVFCAAHLAEAKTVQRRARETRQALRAKYDPGPLHDE